MVISSMIFFFFNVKKIPESEDAWSNYFLTKSPKVEDIQCIIMKHQKVSFDTRTRSFFY